MVTSSRNSSQNCQFFLVIVISHGCSPSFTNSRSVVKTMICLPVTLAKPLRESGGHIEARELDAQLGWVFGSGPAT